MSLEPTTEDTWRPPDLRAIDGIAALGVGLAGYLAAAAVVLAVALLRYGDTLDLAKPPGGVLLLVVFAGQVALLAAPLAVVAWTGASPRRALAWQPVPATCLLAGAVGVIALSLTGDALILWLQQRWPQTHTELQQIVDALRALPAAWAALAVLGLAWLPAAAEEVLFRGVLFTAATARCGTGGAVAVTAVLFALIHCDPVQTPYALLLGVYLGLLRARTGSLWPCLAGHAANNLVASLLMWLAPQQMLLAQNAVVALGGLALAAALLAAAGRRQP